MQTQKIIIALSSCLQGQEVRFDSSHKHNRYITDTLGQYFDFKSFCPEVAIGMGVPRPPIRLVKIGDQIRVRGVKDPEQDVTDELKAYAQQVADDLADVSGYIFKSRSPSCGMERVNVYSEKGHPLENSSGIYAAGIMQAHPSMPVEEEGRLMDSHLRENFIERIYIYHRWQQYQNDDFTTSSLVDFHTRHKFIIQAHDETIYRQLGRMVAEAGKSQLADTANEYIVLLMKALKKLATNKTHTNVLQHIMGFLKENMPAEDKQELLEVIDDYRLEKLPLIVPITLMKHYLRKHPNDYISSQYYLDPHPKELMLRNTL